MGSGKGGCCPSRAGDSLRLGSALPRNAQAAFSAFLAPLTAELSGEVGECRSAGLCQLLSLHREVQHFSELSGESSLCTAMLADISLKHYLRFMRRSSSLLTLQEILGVTKICETLLPILVQLPWEYNAATVH